MKIAKINQSYNAAQIGKNIKTGYQSLIKQKAQQYVKQVTKHLQQDVSHMIKRDLLNDMNYTDIVKSNEKDIEALISKTIENMTSYILYRLQNNTMDVVQDEVQKSSKQALLNIRRRYA